MQKQLLQESVRIIIQLHQELKSSSIISSDLAQTLIQVAGQIEETIKSQPNKKYIDYSKDQNVQRNIKQMKQPQSLSRQSAQCKQILSNDCLNDNIFPFLDLLDLQRFRAVNSEMNYFIQQYMRKRLPEEERTLANHLFSSYYLTEFKQYLYQHLPQQSWFILDYKIIRNNLRKYTKDFETIKRMHNIPDKYECIIRAISILFNGNLKSSALEQLNKVNVRGILDYENIQLFMKEAKKITVQPKRFSIELHNAIQYCYSRISQYYLENIFEICMKIQKQHKFNQIVEYYFRYMKIINFWKQVLQQTERFELVLDFTCFKTQQMVREEQSLQNSFMASINYILNFCNNQTILKFRLINCKLKNICEQKLKERLIFSIYQYESTKLQYYKQNTNNQLGFFNPIFQMSYTLLIEKYKELVLFNKFDNINLWNKEFVFYISTAFQQIHGMQNFNQLSVLSKKQLLNLISSHLNPFNKTQTQIDLADYSLRNLMNLIQINPMTSQNFETIYPFFLYLKLFVIINCSIYPTVYENEQVTFYKQCLYNLRIMFAINQIPDMGTIINEAFSYFANDEKNLIAHTLDQQFLELQNNIEDSSYETTLKLLTQIVALYDSRIISNNIQVVESFEMKKYTEQFSTYILYYLSYQDLAAFACVSKLCNDLQIKHIQNRVFKEQVSIRNLESINKLALQKVLIINKCVFQISKEKAIQLIQQFSHHDFCELRNINHPNKNFEIFSLPFLILFDLKKQNKQSNWQTLQVFFLKQNSFTYIQEISPELICKKKIMAIKEIFKQEDITFENLAKTSTCLLRLYNWLQGIVILHQYLRKYCITDKENQLTIEQQELCRLLDEKQLILYKAMRYINQ